MVAQMAQKLFQIHLKGKSIGENGYATLLGACDALKEFPAGSEVVQVNGEGRVIKVFSAQDCQDALRPPTIRG